MNSIQLGTTTDAIPGTPLTVDVNRLVDSRMLIQGNSGGGKSWLLRLLCERAAGLVPTIVLDPEGEFPSLREKIDAVLVGHGGELSTDLRSAGLLAHKLIELRASAIIDLYELKPAARREYVKLFLTALIELPRALWQPTLICLDEAHKFAPEKGQGDATATESVINLMSLGRKRGFCGIVATQRFSKLHNDVIAETNNVVIGRTWLDADQKRAGDYLGLAPADRKMLRDLKQGEFYGFGPAFSVGGVVKFKSDKVETTHPKPGQRHTLKAPKASDVVKEIAGHLQDLPQRVEEKIRDMAAVQSENTDLQTELRKIRLELDTARNAQPESVERQMPYAVPFFPPDKAAEINESIRKNDIDFDVAVSLLRGIRDRGAGIGAIIGDMPTTLPEPTEVIPVKLDDLATAGRFSNTKIVIHGSTPPQPVEQPSPNGFKLNGSQQRIIDALAWFEKLGNVSPSAVQVGAVALLDATGGHWSNLVGPLSANGIVKRGAGSLSLTPLGRGYAQPVEATPTLAAYHDVLRARVLKLKSASKRTVDVLNVIIKRGGASITTPEIGAEIGIDHTGGHFSNTIGPLSTFGLIERSGGTVTPTEILFPKGLI